MLSSDLFRMSTLQIYRKMRRYRGVLLGIALGIAGLVTVLTMGDSVEGDLGYNLELLGSATIVKATWEFDRSTRWHQGQFYDRDVEAAKKIPGVRSVAPMVWSSQIFSYNDHKCKGRLMGVEPIFFETIHLPTSSGYPINDDDIKSRRSVCVIGKKFVENLFKDDPSPIGKSLDAGGHLFQVIGIIGGVEDPGFEESVLIPLPVARSRFKDMYPIRNIYIRAESWNDVARIHKEAGEVLRANQPGYADAIDVISYPERIQTIQNAVLLVKLFLYAALGVTLLLGGLGITNVMLAAVRERTTEIGLRKAVGATESMIMSQFLLESVLISLIGAVLGIVVGSLSVEVLRFAFGTVPNYSVLLASLVGGVVFAFVLGILSGYLPAKRASKLDPAESMRFE
jgi:putative ABC transport system permease protein